MVFVIILALLCADQLSKFIITKNISLHESVPVLKGIFHLTPVHNTGAAFGIFKNLTPLLIAMSAAAIFLICYKLKIEAKQRKAYVFSLGFILAGAVGNLIDRILFGYVIDFLDFRVWPVFNIADSAITVGAILLGWQLIKPARQRQEIQ